MRRKLIPAVFLIGAVGCTSGDDLVDGVFTQEEMDIIETLSPLPDPPADPTNKYADDPAAAELGQMLYHDESMAAPIKVDDSHWGAMDEVPNMSCAGCHEGPWYDDVRTMPGNVSVGVDWGTRNSPPVVNAVYYEWYYWDGRADSLWGQAIGAAGNGVQQAITRLTAAHTIANKYADEYNAVFTEWPLPDLDGVDGDGNPLFPPTGSPTKDETMPGPWEDMTEENQAAVNRIWANFGKAIAAYERLLVSKNAPFDQYVDGELDAISASAKNGAKLFVGKAACVECHDTPIFTDNEFHNLGVPQEGDHVPDEDEGRHKVVPGMVAGKAFDVNSVHSDDPNTGKLDDLEQDDEQLGAFRTKHLRQVAETGPYMHTGGHATLKEVVEFYNDGGAEDGFSGEKDELMVELNLTDDEVDDLVAFLKTLTGEDIPDALGMNTSK